MIWTLVHGDEGKAPFFKRTHVAGNPNPLFPLPLQHGEHSVQDPIGKYSIIDDVTGIFQGIPLEPAHQRRAVNLKKLEEERTRHQQREQELTENFQAALKEQTAAFTTRAAELEWQLAETASQSQMAAQPWSLQSYPKMIGPPQ